MASEVHELALLDQAGQALAEAKSFDQIKEIRDKAEAVRKYAQSASLGLDIQNRAAEVKLRAERQAGKILSQMMLRGGDRRSKNRDERLKLDDLGISRNQSTRWQLQARVPETVFRDHIRETLEAGIELTSARLIRLAKRWQKSPSSNGVNGRSSRPHRHFGSRGNAGANTDSLADTVSDLINHHQLLENVLRPICSGESTNLTVSERRVLRYLLVETQQLLGQLEKMQHRETGCTCQTQYVVNS